MSERERAITNLMAVDLSGGSHEMLSSIAKAIHKPTCGGWTIGACQVLRDTLVNLLSETDEEALREAYTKGREDGMGVANAKDAQAEYLRGKNDGYDEGWDAGFASADDWCAQHEDAMNEHGWVRLPKDADGEPIHIGDVMDGVNKYDTSQEVTGTVTTISFDATLDPNDSTSVGIRVWADDHKSYRVIYIDPHASVYRHHVSDTWERIIKDAREYRLNIGGSYLWKNKTDELVARCKALAGGEQ